MIVKINDWKSGFALEHCELSPNKIREMEEMVFKALPFPDCTVTAKVTVAVEFDVLRAVGAEIPFDAKMFSYRVEVKNPTEKT